METSAQPVSPRRAQLLARLAAERAYLLVQLEGLDDDTLSEFHVTGGWTAAGILAHLGHWDALYADRLTKLLDGRRDEIRPIGSLNAHNEAMREQFSRLRVTEAVAICRKERRNFLTALGRVPDETLYRRVRLGPTWRITPHMWVRLLYRHDAEHAADLARWRRTYPPNDPSIRVIHRALLRPIMGLSRQEFLALAALMPRDERETRPLTGTWTLKQVMGHLVEYERLGVVALKAVTAGQEPVYETAITSFNAFNNERGPKWATIPWEEVWANFLATRRALLLLADGLSDEALARPFAAPWSGATTACGFLLDMAQHEQEHADAFRRAFGLAALPRRLGRAG